MSDSVVQYLRLLTEWRAAALRDSEQDCTRLLDNADLMRRVRHAKYQFAIMDPATGVSCYYTLPLSLGIPYASLSSPFFTLEYLRIPRLASFSSQLQLTFVERLKSFVVGAVSAALMLLRRQDAFHEEVRAKSPAAIDYSGNDAAADAVVPA